MQKSSVIVDVERAGFGLSPTVFSFLIVMASDDFRVVFVFLFFV